MVVIDEVRIERAPSLNRLVVELFFARRQWRCVAPGIQGWFRLNVCSSSSLTILQVALDREVYDQPLP